MKYLLDTNILIWFTEKNPLLPEPFKDIIFNDENEIFVSLASLWEIAIKFSLGRLKLSAPLELFFKDIEQEYRFNRLPITEPHILKQAQLPFHHSDPFDRLIYSQGVIEGIKFLYTDKIFDLYRE